MTNELEKIKDLNQRAWDLHKKDRQEALQLATQAQSLLLNCSQAQPIDEFECLRTQAYCFDRLSNTTEALPIGLKANLLAEQIGDNFLTSMIQGILGRIYWHIDDFPTAMDYYLNALKLIQTEKHPELENSLINGLGLVQYGLENYPKSLEYFMSSLEKAEKEDLTGQADANNNIAYVLHILKRDQEALQYSTAGYTLHNQLGNTGGKMETLHTLGAIHFSLGNYDQAMTLLQEGIELSRQNNSQLLEITCILEICRILQATGKLDQAEKELLLALQTAEKINSFTNISLIHESLTQIYQEKRDYKSALDHFQAFHATYKKIFNEKSDLRIKNLEILHRVEMTRKQVDLYRERSETDFLTNLVNRRRFLEIAETEFQRVKFEKKQMAVIMLDIDNFKNVNDLYGHLVGDEVLSTLASTVKKTLRPGDVVGRYGGEEYIVMMLGISSVQCFNIAERIRQAVAGQEILKDQALIRVTISLGLAYLDPDQAPSLNYLIDQADQALYAAKQQGRNRTVVWKQIKTSSNVPRSRTT